MAKSDNQKLKLLYILKFLLEESSENHPISTKELIDKLSLNGIKAERKSVYSDMQYLQDFGYDILFNANKINGGFYIASRDFELAELKTLVDMVQSSRFLTLKKSRELISKLEAMTDIYSAKDLARSVYVLNRVKSENESVFYLVDTLNQAMNSNKAVSFQYFEYSVKKEVKLRRDGMMYDVSPFYLVWSNDNYYLIGVDNISKTVKHYRVDRMKNLSEKDNDRQHHELFDNFDIGVFSKGMFNMYDGEKTRITLECDNSLVNVIIDRFGRDIQIIPDGDTFLASCDVFVGTQFYGWVLGLNGKVRIKSPKSAADKLHEYIGNLYHIL